MRKLSKKQYIREPERAKSREYSGQTGKPSALREWKPLAREFFNRDPRIVGPALIGKLLVRREGKRMLAGRVIEAEAYLGTGDLAAHAAAGRTPRNAVLFGPPGHAYVYFIYGAHFCLNVSCLPEGDAGCVLLRALRPVVGLEWMARNRELELPSNGSVAALRAIAAGPGRLAEALAITRERDNGKDVCDPRSDLFFADDGHGELKVSTTPRIGITKNVEDKLRYVAKGDPLVSGKRAR